MSGTEAVMQAVRLARYHTGRKRLVRFAGPTTAGGKTCSPAPATPCPARDHTPAGHGRALAARWPRGATSPVLVNPLQALHPNANAPGDSSLIDGSRRAQYDKAAYTAWLKRLREVCTARGIVLIFDEVFVGFRLAAGGAQQYFGVQADMVTYGKTLGGGLPIGVVCGKAELMKRYREDRPADLCFARGTLQRPPVCDGVHVRLPRPAGDTRDPRALYEGLDDTWNRRAASLNAQLEAAGHPVRRQPPDHLDRALHPARPLPLDAAVLPRQQGLAPSKPPPLVSWVGTGRFIFSLNYTEDDFTEVAAASSPPLRGAGVMRAGGGGMKG